MEKKNKRVTPFTTAQNINRKCTDRDIILFGVGGIAEKTLRLLNKKKIEAVVDNASNLWGEFDNGVEVFSPKYLESFKSKFFFIIICTTSFTEVSDQLLELGFRADEDFCVSPILNDLMIIDELENIKKKIIFTSGSPKQSSNKYGGGIYELNVNEDSWDHKKVISGNCYGLIKYRNNYISVDTEIGIFEFDKNYTIIRSKKLPHGMRAHGIDYSKKYNKFFVVGSHRDAVLVLDNNFEIVDEIKISDKKEKTGVPQHHANDCLVIDDSLYVSMFSVTGNWRKDVFDGAVLEYDILTGNLVGPVISDLWMPHNIKTIQGSLHVLNSLQGQLLTNNSQVVGDFPAFSRGLAHDEIFYFIGQSRNRNFSKNIGLSKNISIDAGIIIFDSFTKVSRFLQLPPKISEIHSILIA